MEVLSQQFGSSAGSSLPITLGTGYLGSIPASRRLAASAHAASILRALPEVKLASKLCIYIWQEMSYLFRPVRQFGRPLSQGGLARSIRLNRIFIANMSGTTQEARQIPLWINGKDVVTSKTFEVQHPSSGRAASSVCSASEDDV